MATLKLLFWKCQNQLTWHDNFILQKSHLGYSRMVFVNGTLYTGFVQSLEFLKTSWNLPWKKSGKMVKSLQFFQSYSKCFICELFFSFCPYVCSASWKKLCACVFFKASLDRLRDNLESGKRSHCFGKGLGKVLALESKNLYKPCTFKGFCEALTLPSKCKLQKANFNIEYYFIFYYFSRL